MIRIANNYTVDRKSGTYLISKKDILSKWKSTSYSEYLSTTHFSDMFVGAYFDFDNI